MAEALPNQLVDLFDYTALAKLAIFQDFAGVLVPADVDRRLLDQGPFIDEHFVTQGQPDGHGFPFGTHDATTSSRTSPPPSYAISCWIPPTRSAAPAG